jgi:hypothetical protein
VREEELIDIAQPPEEMKEVPNANDVIKGERQEGRFNVDELLAGIVGTDLRQA